MCLHDFSSNLGMFTMRPVDFDYQWNESMFTDIKQLTSIYSEDDV